MRQARARLRARCSRACWRGRRSRWPSASLLLAGGGALLTRLGAEFVPQLDEGDLLIEARRLPGIALIGDVATDHADRSRRSREHPRGATTSSPRAGAPEVATDPMGIEQSDVYITLKDRGPSGARV